MEIGLAPVECCARHLCASPSSFSVSMAIVTQDF